MLKINTIHNMNCIDGMKLLDDNSIDSIVTDPPYELGFMGKAWDNTGIAYSVDLWRECLRVLKHGGHLLAFGGTRTYHRMACAIEDAGFEIRDQIQWIYGSGFPKSLDIGKAVDKMQGNGRKLICDNPNKRPNSQPQYSLDGENKNFRINVQPITKGNSAYEGWGTALKPANEPICLARKPLSEKTVAENVLKWGTGGLNIDGSRVEGKPRTTHKNGNQYAKPDSTYSKGFTKTDYLELTNHIPQGRFPANVLFDEDAAKELDRLSGSKTTTRHMSYKRSGKGFIDDIPSQPEKDWFEQESGGASRFFYVPKASTRERNEGCEGMPDTDIPYADYRENVDTTKSYVSQYPDGSQRPMNKPKNNHPTVKPIKLMEYLVKLVTPPNGIVLDPFMGSGTTAIACVNNGFQYIGFEMDEHYCEIAEKRIAYHTEQPMLVNV